MPGTFKTNYLLLILWLIHSGLVLFLAYINPNHYTTIDSQYYLQSADNMLAGQGYTIREGNEYQWNGTFPIGYPAVISFVSFFTKINVLWSSKLVNIAASGIWLFFLNQEFGRRKSVVLGSVLFLGSFLKLWAHTWSEPLFLVVLFCWVYHFNYLTNSPNVQKSRIIYVLILGLLLMLVRYAGIFIIPVALGYAVFWIYKKEKNKSLLFGLLAFFWSLGFVCYLYLNQYQSGEWYGGDRFKRRISIVENISAFSKGLLNELFLNQNTDFQSFDLLFLTGITFQIFIVLLLRKQWINKIVISKWAVTCWIIAGFYLVFLFTLRILSHFDEPGYRLLSPFTFLVLYSLLHSVPEEKLTGRLKNLLIVFIVFSWMEIIPKNGSEKKVNFILQKHITIWKR